MPGNGFARDFCNECDRRCCSRPVVLPEEKENIIMGARLGVLRRMRIFQRRGDYYIIRGETCPFLKEGKCSIEEVRPLNCRIFPVVLAHRGKDADWTVSPECPSCNDVPYEFVECAKEAGQPLLERHRKHGPLT